jgi:hypothetical protein
MYILTIDLLLQAISDPSTPHRGCPTRGRQQLSNSNKHLVMSPVTFQSQRDFDLLKVSSKQLHQHSAPVNFYEEHISSEHR